MYMPQKATTRPTDVSYFGLRLAGGFHEIRSRQCCGDDCLNFVRPAIGVKFTHPTVPISNCDWRREVTAMARD